MEAQVAIMPPGVGVECYRPMAHWAGMLQKTAHSLLAS
jgi:hypothetical protein